MTGQVGWGIAWYINGQLIPELHVERNHTYTFKIYGGDDEDALATYHPFYITDDKDGGYTQKSEAEKRVIALLYQISIQLLLVVSVTLNCYLNNFSSKRSGKTSH